MYAINKCHWNIIRFERTSKVNHQRTLFFVLFEQQSIRNRNRILLNI